MYMYHGLSQFRTKKTVLFYCSYSIATVFFTFFPFLFLGAGEMYYYVVFNGFHVTEQKITSYSKNDKV